MLVLKRPGDFYSATYQPSAPWLGPSLSLKFFFFPIHLISVQVLVLEGNIHAADLSSSKQGDFPVAGLGQPYSARDFALTTLMTIPLADLASITWQAVEMFT